MASAVIMGIGQSLFSAFAFAGAGSLMHMLDKKSATHELERHDKAIEKMARHKQEWAEGLTRRRGMVSAAKSRLKEAIADETLTNKSLELLRLNLKMHQKRLIEHEKEKPTKHHYYTPSETGRGYQLGATTLAGGVVGLGAAALMAGTGIL